MNPLCQASQRTLECRTVWSFESMANQLIALITAAIPFDTAAAKKILKTVKWGEKKSGWNALIPIVIGIVSAGAYAHSQ